MRPCSAFVFVARVRERTSPPWRWHGSGRIGPISRSSAFGERSSSARGVPCGVMGTSVADARMRQEQGFRMIGVASDTGLLIRGATEALKALRPE